VAIVGAGGIGFDVAELLSHETLEGDELAQFTATWGVDLQGRSPGGLTAPVPPCVPREVWLLQRKADPLGKNLGKTTGWIRRALLRRRGVHLLSGVVYDRFDDEGLHLQVDGVARILPVDNVVICAGQEPDQSLLAELEMAGQVVSLVGGARMASELDATRAIDEGVRLACIL
jgi:2,4-dienoyl-CoA reductase (NADPH2)